LRNQLLKTTIIRSASIGNEKYLQSSSSLDNLTQTTSSSDCNQLYNAISLDKLNLTDVNRYDSAIHSSRSSEKLSTKNAQTLLPPPLRPSAFFFALSLAKQSNSDDTDRYLPNDLNSIGQLKIADLLYKKHSRNELIVLLQQFEVENTTLKRQIESE
jgi:hypothetical protein